MARRPAPPSPPRSAILTADQIKRGIDRLGKRVADLEAFDPHTVQKRWAPEVAALEAAIKETLASIFGSGTVEYRLYDRATRLDSGPATLSSDASWISARHGGINRRDSLEDVYHYLAEGKKMAILLLNQAIRSLEEKIISQPIPDGVELAGDLMQHGASKIFIVHGHDEHARESVTRFVERLGFEAIILHERPNKGRTIITKFREEADGVGFAIVLMTPDDIGGRALTNAAPVVNARARQNVVFELGFFIGALGPERVAAMIKGDVERPSDFEGVLYIPMDRGDWRLELGRELKAAGYTIDWNRIMD